MVTRLAGGSPAERALAAERCEAIDLVGELLREHYRDGASSVRVVIEDVPEHVWQEQGGTWTHRFPTGDVKSEELADGLRVEWERRPPEARETPTIPLERSRT